jgi:hypothetical protein
MTRSVRASSARRQDPATIPPFRPASHPWLQTWLLAFLLILGRCREDWFGSVVVIEPPLNCLLTPAWAWSIPAGQLLPETGLRLPVWLFAALAAVVLSGLATAVRHRLGSWTALVAVMGWAWGIVPSETCTAALVLLLVPLLRRKEAADSKGIALLTLWMLVCPLVSLSFGLLWPTGIAAFLLTVPREQRRQKFAWTAIALSVAALGAVIVAGQARGGFLAAGLRVWSGMFVPMLAFPEAGSFWNRPILDLAGQMCLLMFLLLCCRRAWNSSLPVRIGIVWLLAFCGLTSHQALWPATVAIVLLLPPQGGSAEWKSLPRLARIGIGAVALLLIAPSLPTAMLVLTGTPVPQRQVHPEEWPTSGHVMPMNLNRSQEWSSPSLRAKYRLLLNDRWDVFDSAYRSYFIACREVTDFQPHRRLLEDGSWGGYRRTFQDWQPELVEIDITALEQLRRFSLSTDFRLAGLDGGRVLFASTHDAAGQAVSAMAGQAVLQLEWPGMAGRGIPPNVIVAESARDHDRVAAALVAMRLPVAGLRVLRSGPRPENFPLQADGYLELAHRVRQQSGTVSLLDQGRALARIRGCSHDITMDPEIVLRWARSVAGLNEERLARELALGVKSRMAMRWLHPQIGAQVDELLEALSSLPACGPNAGGPDQGATEKKIRLLIAAGLPAEALAAISQQSEPYCSYYHMLATALLASADDTLASLQDLLAKEQIPAANLAEALFYLGCLANEIGDPETAAKAFLRCQELSPEHPFRPLRELYLQRILGN